MSAETTAAVSGFVLAGGASRRMGQDKALVEVGGVALAVRLARILAAGGCDPVTLVGSQPALAGLGLPVLPDPPGEHHPLRGVAVALAACSTPLALFAPCDLVGLQAAHVRSMVALGGPCVAVARGRVHPLLAVLLPAMAAWAAEIALTHGPARALVQALPRVELPEDALENVNTVAALEGWLSRGGGATPGGAGRGAGAG